MKLLKLSALAVGAAAMITGFGACNKDEGQECCTFSYSYSGNTMSAEACEDGKISYTYKYADGTTETETGDWKTDYSSWTEVKDMFIEYGGSCD